MKVFGLFAVAAVILLPCAGAAQTDTAEKPESCMPEGAIQFACGQSAAEDLAHVPGTNWIVTSGLTGEGGIRLVNIADRTMTMAFPAAGVQEKFDSKTYDDCPGPLDAEDKAKYISQGNALQAGKDGQYTLYSVHRGKRESIEVFNLDARAKTPILTWIGCVAAPNDWVRLNSVVGLPGGGLAVTNLRAREGSAQFEDSRRKLTAGESNGFIWEWHTGKGWAQVLGSEGSGLNGIEVSKDGKWFYVDAWGSKDFFRLSRGSNPPKRDTIPVGFRIDNVKWGPDGMLIAAGQTENGTKVVEIDPKTLALHEILDHPNTKIFFSGSVAIPVGKTLWVGSFRSNRIAAFPLPQ
ncbi:MAG TPA: WD40 repeat domain-containing protein [Rhizomicrobium sp.]|jgi:hypothetical protein